MKRVPLACGLLLAACVAHAERGITDSAEAQYDKGADITALTVTLVKNDAGYRLATRWRGKPLEAIALHQKLSGWKGDYFFVRDDCLVSADTAPWRCVREHVFALADKGERLAYLGSVFAGEDCIEERKFGCSLYKDVFTDIYDLLEKNTLVAREESPALLLELRAKDGAFVADLDETWTRNQERYRAGNRCLAASPAERKTQCTEGIAPLRSLLFNLTLTRYTQRRTEYEELRKHVYDTLCLRVGEADCGVATQSLDYLMDRVVPGELPKRDAKVTAISAKPQSP